MRFVRHLLVVCLVVAAVIGLGVVWSHTGAADLVADGRDGDRDRDRRELSDDDAAAAEVAPADGSAPTDVPDRRFDRRRGHEGVLDRIAELVQTMALEVLIIGAVIVVDRRHRRRRLARRIAS